MEIIEKLGYSKVCASWVPLMVPDAPKETRKATATNLLCQYDWM
jgi:hypothetical protein